MRRLPIHVRLTAWYLASLLVIITLFATSSWYAMRASMSHSIDRDLGYRMQTVVPFIESRSLNTAEGFAKTFARASDSSVVGVFVQVTDAQSRMLFESDVLAGHKVPVFPRGAADGSMTRETVIDRGWPVRVASKRIDVDGVELTVHVVEPLRDLLAALRELTLYFAALVPIALLLTAFVGYWISGRALAPVEEMRQEAEAIDHADLAARLPVPRSDDELGRLARTLNSMLARIEAGYRSVEQFTADASHELRAPLAFIITAADVSLRRPRTREELADALAKIVAEARRMSKLVEDLLALARGDAQHLRAVRGSVDLGAVVHDVAAECEAAASAKGLELRATAAGEAVCVDGVEAELRRMVFILVDNAIKYTDSGWVEITLTRDSVGAKVIVRDTGIGMEAAVLPHVFDRFWRADKVRSRAENGVGLGLSIAAQIAARHDGSIAVESVPGSGSTFTVTLKSATRAAADATSEDFQVQG